VVVDTYHVWWNPELSAGIARAGAEGRLAGYQVSDWVLPLPADALLSRGNVGDGYIDFASITAQVTAAGYRGPVETEIFRQDIWDANPQEVVATVAARFASHLLAHLREQREGTSRPASSTGNGCLSSS
jgi:sugar phosphate isomerase/epimerase